MLPVTNVSTCTNNSSYIYRGWIIRLSEDGTELETTNVTTNRNCQCQSQPNVLNAHNSFVNSSHDRLNLQTLTNNATHVYETEI